MRYSITLLSLVSLAAAAPKAVPAANPLPVAGAAKHGSSYATTMGPVTFLYPDTRQWAEDVDNIAPCGSNAGVQNRSDFPLDDGFVAFIAKYISYKVKLSISYDDDPQSQDDFDEWYYGVNVTDELHIGHTCFYMPELPSSINAGDVATIQAIYQNDDEDETDEDGVPIESGANETFYFCSDVTFVEESVFDVTDYALSCFNATNDNYYSESTIETDTSSATYDSSQVSEVSSVRATASTTATSSAATSTSSSSAGAVIAMVANPIAGVLGLAAFIASNLI